MVSAGYVAASMCAASDIGTSVITVTLSIVAVFVKSLAATRNQRLILKVEILGEDCTKLYCRCEPFQKGRSNLKEGLLRFARMYERVLKARLHFNRQFWAAIEIC